MGFLVFTLQRETLQSSHQLELLVSPETFSDQLTRGSYVCHSTGEETPHEEARVPETAPGSGLCPW